jgi:hypothetical protein
MKEELEEVPRIWRCKEQLPPNSHPGRCRLSRLCECFLWNPSVDRGIVPVLLLYPSIDCEMPKYSWRYWDASRIVELVEIHGARPDQHSTRDKTNLNCIDSSFWSKLWAESLSSEVTLWAISARKAIQTCSERGFLFASGNLDWTNLTSRTYSLVDIVRFSHNLHTSLNQEFPDCMKWESTEVVNWKIRLT